MRITVGIPTRDRPMGLARLLASLHNQTYRDFDVVIVNDSSGSMLNEFGEMMRDALVARGNSVYVVPGARINQTYAHNHVLWSPDSHPWILRVDDDCILAPGYIQGLVESWCELESTGINVGAISGVVFTDHIYSRNNAPPIHSGLAGSLEVGVRGEDLRAMTYMQEYEDDTLLPAEHLYSSYLYSRDAMRQVGGFPLVYSRGVSYHEETDASYRLHLGGYKLFLRTGIAMVHNHEGAGGTRLMSPQEHRRRRESDWELFQMRLGLLRGIRDFVPSVAICSQHIGGIGGAQRLTYDLFNELSDLAMEGWLKFVHLYPLLNEQMESQEFVSRYYGDSYSFEIDDAPEYYDVVISIGHRPPEPSEIPPRRHHIHYSLYPIGDGKIPKKVDRYTAISEFSALGVMNRYHRNPEVIYPCVDMAGVMPSDVTKDRMILMVGRASGSKALADLANLYLDMDLPDGTELHIVIPQLDAGDECARLESMTARGDVFLHVGISAEELDSLYLRARVLWAGRGYGMPKIRPDLLFEHFGYTPVDALAHYCVPVAYDEGGYRETTLLRWRNLDDLRLITQRLLNDMDWWLERLDENLRCMERFSKQRFRDSWLRVILSSNAYAWDHNVEWRKPDQASVTVESADIHVAVLSDHPSTQTGYGVISNQLCDGLLRHGIKVHVLGMNGSTPDVHNKYASLWPVPRGQSSFDALREMLTHRDMDAAVVCYDPFISRRLINAVKRSSPYLPIISYVSQEGYPAHSAWEMILHQSNVTLTLCRSAAAVVKDRFSVDIDWVYLGVDHAPFEQYPYEDRRALRSILGWEDRFVIFNVSRNTRNKNLAGMIDVVSRLARLHPEMRPLLVLHTNPVPDERFHGIDTEMYAQMVGLMDDESERYIAISDTNALVPYGSKMNEMLRSGVPRSQADVHEWFTNLGMVDRYNLADLYLDMSTAEGFCLPIFEAMACGVPVISVDDAYVRSEIIGRHSGLIPALHGFDTWITGVDLALPDRELAARKAFREFDRHDVAIRGEHAAAIVGKLKWKDVQDKILEAIRRCLN